MPKSVKKSKEPTCINTNVGSVIKLVRQALEQCGSEGSAAFNKVLPAQAELGSALVNTSKTTPVSVLFSSSAETIFSKLLF